MYLILYKNNSCFVIISEEPVSNTMSLLQLNIFTITTVKCHESKAKARKGYIVYLTLYKVRIAHIKTQI